MRQILFCSLANSTILLLLNVIVFLSGCASSTKVVCEPVQIPAQLLQKELPLANEWQQSYLNFLTSVGTDGNDAPSAKTP